MTDGPKLIYATDKAEPKRLYVVSVSYPNSPDDEMGIFPQPQKVDKALDPLGEWVRLNGFTWLVWTDQDAVSISKSIQDAVGEKARILSMRVSQYGMYGWQPNWVWKWLETHRPEPQAGLGPPNF
jgi:hypothetical protein